MWTLYLSSASESRHKLKRMYGIAPEPHGILLFMMCKGGGEESSTV